MILGMTLCYGIIKFIDLYEGNDPNIRQNIKEYSFDIKEKMTFADDFNFRLALGTKYKDEETLTYDP